MGTSEQIRISCAVSLILTASLADYNKDVWRNERLDEHWYLSFSVLLFWEVGIDFIVRPIVQVFADITHVYAPQVVAEYAWILGLRRYVNSNSHIAVHRPDSVRFGLSPWVCTTAGVICVDMCALHNSLKKFPESDNVFWTNNI
jgi:hypothetical protein